MDYFISIENCQYMIWQAELLKESLKLLNMEDKLVVGCTEGNTLANFDRVLYHENVGRQSGCLCANKPYAVWKALEQKVISLPVFVLDPDCIVVLPIKPKTHSFSAQYCWFMEPKNLKEYNLNFDNWKSAGVMYQANENIFQNVFLKTIKLKNLKNKTANWQKDMVAFNQELQKFNDVEVVNDYEMPLDDRIYCPNNRNAHVIHYCNGLIPYFDKRLHNDKNFFSFRKSLPFEDILKIPSISPRVKYFKKIVRSYLK